MRGPVGTEAAQRVREGLLLVGVVGNAEGVHQCQGLASGEAVSADGRQGAVLVITIHVGEGERERGSNIALAEALLGCGTEFAADGDAPFDPPPLASQEARDGTRRELVLVNKGTDDARLVERRGGARWCVGGEQDPLLLRRAGCRLNDNRDQVPLVVDPPGQALETVHDLVGPLQRRNHAQRQVGNGTRARW